MTVLDAIRAFGTPLRLRLIRHYADNPSTQKAAAEVLGVRSSLIQVNTGVLVELRLVRLERGVYTVDRERVEELKRAIYDYLPGA